MAKKKEENKPNFTNLQVKEVYKPTEVKNIDLALIDPSPLNPRKTFDEDSLKELAKNIAEQGLLQPITVRNGKDNEYEIVCGERRFRAAHIAGLTFIPSIVRNLTDEEAFDAMITENLQRKDVEPMDEARAFNELFNRGAKVEELSARFGKSETFILNRMKLAELIPDFVTMLEKKELPVSHALELCKLDQEEQQEIYIARYSPDTNYWTSWKEKTVKELKELLSNRFKDLDKAAFDKTECATCEHNCSVNLLFQEFNKNGCKNSICYENKRIDHAVQLAIQKIEAGYVLAKKARSNDVIIDKLEEMGYEFAMFEYNWEHPTEIEDIDRDDYDTEEEYKEAYNECLAEITEEEEKIKSGELIRAWCIGYWGNNTGTYILLKKLEEGKDLNDLASEEKETLLSKDKRNKEIQKEKTVEDTRQLLEDSDYERLNTPLSDLEELALLTIILKGAGYTLRNDMGIEALGMSGQKVIDAAQRLTPEQSNSVIRSFIRKELSDGLNWNEHKKILLQQISTEKFPEKTEEIKLKHEGVYLKRQANINKKIAELKK